MAENETGTKGFWRSLYEQMLADFNSPAFRRFGSYTIAGRSYTYRSIQDFLDLLKWVKTEAEKEEGLPGYTSRRLARNANRGGRC